MTRITTTTRLQRGEALHIPLDHLTTLEVDSGRVVVREPMHWLGETMVSPTVTLSHGESHRLERGGWVEVRACGGTATVRSQRPEPVAYLAWRRLRRRLQSVLRLARVEGR
jgi:hypothetical protein